jgi:tetrahydromethanopterin S-methyltransferase subunit C
MKIVLGIFTLVMMIIGTILNGAVLATLWKWFVVPTFNLPLITINTAIGLSLIVGYMAKQVVEDKTEYVQKCINECLKAIMVPGFALLIGWIIAKIGGII